MRLALRTHFLGQKGAQHNTTGEIYSQRNHINVTSIYTKPCRCDKEMYAIEPRHPKTVHSFHEIKPLPLPLPC